MNYGEPEPLTPAHVTTGFDCGSPALNRWLERYALGNEATGRSRTFIVRSAGGPNVVAFYCLSTAVVQYQDATSRASAGLPRNEPIPAVLLGRLAVDTKHQGRGLGSALLADAVERTYFEIARNAGVRVLLVHAKDETAQQFYIDRGFEASPTDPLHVMYVLHDLPRSLP